MAKKDKYYDKGSIMDFAVQGFSNIKKLSESALISEKLLGLNTLMFVLIMSFSLSSWYAPASGIFTLDYLLIFLLFFAISLGISLIYSPILSLVANFSSNKVASLRVGLMVMFLDLPISVAGLLYGIEILTKIALGIIGLQIVLILFGAVIRYSKDPTPDIEVEPSDMWKVINKVAAICGILSFVVTILLII